MRLRSLCTLDFESLPSINPIWSGLIGLNGVIFSFCLVWALQIIFRLVLIKDIGR